MGLRSYPSGSFVPETPSTSFSLIRSDKLVYTTASIRPTGPCQPSTALAGPMFSYLGNPYPHVSGGLHDFYGRLHAGVGCSHGGFPWLIHMGTWTRTDRRLHINYLELKAVVFALQHWAPVLQGHQVMITTNNSTVVSYINKQGGTHSPHLVTFDSRASPLVRGSEHNSPSEAYSRLSECDSRPPISSESANIDRLVPPPLDRETYLQALGDTRSRHVCNSVELPPSLVHVSNSGATSPSGGCSVSGLAGEVNVHVSSIQSAQQSHSEAPVHPGSRSYSRSPLLAETVMVFHTYFVFVWITPTIEIFCPSRIRSMSLHAWRLSCDTIKQQAYQTRSLSSPQPLRGPQPIACTTIGGFASFLGPHGKGLIRLIPQLLR